MRTRTRLTKSFFFKTVGFTIIEMLIVLAVIATLAALLFPVFARARGRAQMTSCASNLHQIYIACAIYTVDYDGYLPNYTSRPIEVRQNGTSTFVEQSRELVASLHPYTRNDAIWICPSDHQTFNPRMFTLGGLPVPHVTSYWYYGIGHRLQFAIRPLLIDRPDYATLTTRQLLTDDISRVCDGNYPEYNHNGRLNVVFLDGHVKSQPQVEDPQSACP